MAKVFVQPRKARPFWFGHPWVFSGAIDRVKGDPRDGSVVELCDHEGKTIGSGWWNGRSQIRVRLVALAHEGALDDALLVKRLDRAIDLRLDAMRLQETASVFRLVHSEGDLLPGLVIDAYREAAGETEGALHLVMQVTALGMTAHLPALIARLVERLAPASITERASGYAAEEEGIARADAVHHGDAPVHPICVVENGVRYWCDIRAGQKTGFFADQRDNRRAVLPYVKGKSVLDAFCYVGGFGLPALVHGGAASVHFLDSSGFALELAQRGAASNGVAERATFEDANVLRVLDRWGREGRMFGVVMVDPPKLVHRRMELEKGLRLYHEINRKAVGVLEDGGILVTHSCSQHVSESDFEHMLSTVAKETGCRFQLLHRGTQGADHPVMLPHDESRYLKSRVFRVVKPPEGFVPFRPDGPPRSAPGNDG
jgi:23S rRNA (cytosine1962-C5)-methyltransferase